MSSRYTVHSEKSVPPLEIANAALALWSGSRRSLATRSLSAALPVFGSSSARTWNQPMLAPHFGLTMYQPGTPLNVSCRISNGTGTCFFAVWRAA